MAKRSRPAQGNNSNRRLTKLAAGGDNVNSSKSRRAPKSTNNKRKGIYG